MKSGGMRHWWPYDGLVLEVRALIFGYRSAASESGGDINLKQKVVEDSRYCTVGIMES